MKKMLNWLAGNLLLLLVVVLSGCGGSDGGKGRLAPVNGRVLFKNEGVTAGEIYFLPDESRGNQGPMASSLLQEDGSFTMTTQDVGQGLRPGAYKVTIVLGRRPEKELARSRTVKTTPLAYEVSEEGLTGLVIALDDPKYREKEQKQNDIKK